MISQANSGACLSKTKILHYLLEGTTASNVEGIGDEEKDSSEGSNHDINARKCCLVWFALSLSPCQYVLDFIYAPACDNFIRHYSGKRSSKWVKVNEKRTLHDVLKEPDFIIQGIPGMFSKKNKKLLAVWLKILH